MNYCYNQHKQISKTLYCVNGINNRMSETIPMSTKRKTDKLWDIHRTESYTTTKRNNTRT